MRVCRLVSSLRGLSVCQFTWHREAKSNPSCVKKGRKETGRKSDENEGGEQKEDRRKIEERKIVNKEERRRKKKEESEGEKE